MDGEHDISSGLTPEQDLAIAALLNEPTVAKAAAAAGVPERTLYRWMTKDDAFMAAHRRGRREAFGQAIGMCQRLAPMGLSTLAKVMSDPGTSASARVSAASALLKFGREALELDDLAARVEALEKAAQSMEKPR